MQNMQENNQTDATNQSNNVIWRSVPTSLDVFVEKVLLPGKAVKM